MRIIAASILMLAVSAVALPAALHAQAGHYNEYYYEDEAQPADEDLIWDLPSYSLLDDESSFMHIYIQPLCHDNGDNVLDSLLEYGLELVPMYDKSCWDEANKCPVYGSYIVRIYIDATGRVLAGFEEQPDSHFTAEFSYYLFDIITGWYIPVRNARTYAFLITFGLG
jgi:hypothetical protein